MLIPQIDRESVKQIRWRGDPLDYDYDLYRLGRELEEFIVPNPNIAVDLTNIIKRIPQTNRCVVWWYEGQWIAKRFNSKWKPEYGYYDIQVPKSALKFNFLWIRNPDLDNIRFSEDPYRKYVPSLDESFYELVWYLDSNYNPNDERIWAVKCVNQDNPCLGPKDMGEISPQLEIVYNPKLPILNYDLEYHVPYWNLKYEHQYMLDPSHCENAVEDIWAFRINFSNNPAGLKIAGNISPTYQIEQNPSLPSMSFDIGVIPYYDFGYEHIWMLDEKHCKNAVEPIWALKIKYTNNVVGTKDAGQISPLFFLEYNPDLPNLKYDLEYAVPYHDFKYEHVWMLDKRHCENAVEDIWAFKVAAASIPQGTKIVGEIAPSISVSYNPELPKLDYDVDYTIPYHDLGYEHILMLDEKHCENAVEDIWALKFSATDSPVGEKIIGEISPRHIEVFNPALPNLTYDLDYNIHYHDLGYDHVWMLDEKHTVNLSEEIWAVKIKTSKRSSGTKVVGKISPRLFVEVNKDLKGFNFSIPNTDIQYHDLVYKHVWMLDPEHSAGFDIWAVKISAVKNTKEEKLMGYIGPDQHFIINPDLKNLSIKIDYKIPYHDKNYEHVWYLDTGYTKGEKVWAAKLSATIKPKGTKEMGYVVPEIRENLDVVFISYHEPNAEENWQRVKSKAPWAKRVDSVKGIFEAHKAAAKLSSTDMFYVVDGDAWLVDDWQFNYQPGIFDRDCVYIWASVNPINELTYGHGGVKLFAKSQLMKKRKWDTLDMTTGIMPKLKVIDKVSNINAFATDDFSTWRTAFRECVKLCANLEKNPGSIADKERLIAWKSKGTNNKLSYYAHRAAAQAELFYQKNKNNPKTLQKINDRTWLKNKYKALFRDTKPHGKTKSSVRNRKN